MSTPLANVYRETLEYWKEFNLSGRRQSLDDQAVSVAAVQEQTASSRKTLSDKTREFKKMDDSRRLQEFGGLLKMYQKMVDDVTRRAKDAEKGFLSIYQSIAKAPDPVPALELGLEAERVADLELENAKLEEKLKEYREDIAEVHNQDVTIRNLEEKVRLFEVEMEQTIETKVAEREAEMKEELASAFSSLKSREKELEAHFQAVDIAVQNAQQSRESAQKQLADLKASLDEERANTRRERDLALGSEDTIELERRVEEAVQAMFKSRREGKDAHGSKGTDIVAVDGDLNSAGADIGVDIASLQAQIRQHESLIDALQDQLVEEQNQAESKIEGVQQERKRLESQLISRNKTIDDLRTQIASYPTPEQYDTLEKKLKALQATTVDALDDDSKQKEKDTTLESLLMQKNRKLAVELTRLRQEVSEAQALLTTTNDKLSREQDTSESLRNLVKKLEDDLARVQISDPISSVSASDNTASTPYRGSTAVIMSTPSVLMSPPPASASPSPSPAVDGAAVDDSMAMDRGRDRDQSELLRIVTSQRDRFRERVVELEGAVFAVKRDIGERDRQIVQLREDNVKLFEKIRYLQSFNESEGSGSGALATPSKSKNKDGLDSLSQLESDGQLIGDGDSSVTEAKYRGIYEERMNPFAAFSRLEKRKRITQLGATDRVTLRVGEFVLSRKPIRTFIFFYALLLHVLVFFTLYYVASFRCPGTGDRGVDLDGLD